MFTIVFLSFHSELHVKRLVFDIKKKYPIIVIENSLNVKLKKELEEKFDNVKVIIPPKNIGLSAGYNLGIKESKTNLVFLNPTDVVITNECLENLEECISKIKDFTLLAPTYDDESVYKNYEIFEDKKIYVSQKIKFTHYGSQSVSSNFSHKIALSRSWHYNWSKFYYFKKNFGYLIALRKIFPNFLRSLKRLLISKIYNKKIEYSLHKAELSGIMTSVFNKPSDYRPFEIE